MKFLSPSPSPLLLAVFVGVLASAKADVEADLTSWFSQPETNRGALPGSLSTPLKSAAEVKAAAGKVWAAYKAGAIALHWDKDLPPLLPSLEEIKTMAPEARPKLAPTNLVEQGKTMPFFLLTKGGKGTNGWPLFISLHGGGKSSQKVEPHGWRVNSSEWQAQVKLFTAIYPTGMYFIPRMADDNDGRWYYDYCQTIYDRVIRRAILFRDVDPNRVYIMGISEGGYSGFRLGSHMADRWAGSCAMAAAEPVDTSPVENFRNVPFICSIGENDRMFNRIDLARKYFGLLEELQRADGSTNAYVHKLDEQKERGHGIDYRTGPEWIAKKVRNPWPDRVAWTVKRQHNTVRRQMYWLALDEVPKTLPVYLTASIEKNTVVLNSVSQPKGQSGSEAPVATGLNLRVYLNDHLADLDKPVKIVANGKTVFEGKVVRSVATLARSLNERGDPNYMFPAEVEVKL